MRRSNAGLPGRPAPGRRDPEQGRQRGGERFTVDVIIGVGAAEAAIRPTIAHSKSRSNQRNETMTNEATEEPGVVVPGQDGIGSPKSVESGDRSGEPEAAGEIVIGSRSDVGQVRSANEDTCDTFERPDGTRLLVVADGMGGHQGGATASRTAVETIAEVFNSETSADLSTMLRDAIQTANHRIFERAQSEPGLGGMGTTVVSFLLNSAAHGIVAHVGDSRAYRYRQGQLEPLTVDHSVVAEMMRRGVISADEAAVHPRRNEILRAVGIAAEVDVEVAPVEVSPGDQFLLCSDGLTGVLSDDEIAAVVQAESPKQAVDKLIQIANDRGAPDNVTVQILSVPSSESEGDPEATAPVELSAIGIKAIEAKRSERRRMRIIMLAAIGLAGCFVLYLAWQTLSPSPGRPIDKPFIESLSEQIGPTKEMPPAPVIQDAEDSFSNDAQQPPRRGVPQSRD